MRVWDKDIDFSDFLLDENLYQQKYENILIYDILYKIWKGAKPLCFRLNKIGGFIRLHGEIRYLVLFAYAWFDKICEFGIW